MQRLLRIQQEQINCLVVLNKEQAGIIERNQRETYNLPVDNRSGYFSNKFTPDSLVLET